MAPGLTLFVAQTEKREGLDGEYVAYCISYKYVSMIIIIYGVFFYFAKE